KSNASKALIYIGDGISAANIVTLDDYRRLVATLAEEQVAVTSYGVGQRVDSGLLASLANQTGGTLALDSESIDPKQGGAFLASAARGTVLWLGEVAWPKQFAEIYPEHIPPLRSDRDTVLIGKGTLDGDQAISMTATVAGKSLPLKWTVTPDKSN